MRHLAPILVLLVTTQTQAATPTPAHPIDRPMPAYPAAALNQPGHVTLRFTIAANGHTQNTQIIQSTPPGLFDQSARAAIAAWLYTPRTEGGRPVSQPDNLVNLTFEPPDPEPLFRPTLVFPRQAYASHTEGTVTVAFDINQAGLTANLQVVASIPPGIFDKAALQNVADWQYPPQRPASLPPRQTAQLAYTLANAELDPVKRHAARLAFPTAAIEAQIYGDCNVAFWIEPDGTTSGEHILACTPSGYFERATLNYVRSATYQPEADANLNHRRYHSVAVHFRFRGTEDTETGYLKPGQWIKLRFTRTTNGRAKDIEVIDQSAPNLPTDRAIEQLRETTLSTVTENGHPVEKPGSTIIITKSKTGSP